jgi:hypothetical protein
MILSGAAPSLTVRVWSTLSLRGSADATGASTSDTATEASALFIAALLFVCMEGAPDP